MQFVPENLAYVPWYTVGTVMCCILIYPQPNRRSLIKKWATYQDKLLTYTDFNKWFDLHTYDRNIQLGVDIIQIGEPVGFYILKLTGYHTRHTTIKKYQLSAF